MRSKEAMEKRKKYRESIGRKTVPPGNLLEQIQMMYPTPTAGCEEGGEQSDRVEQTKSGGFVLRKKNKPNMTFGAKLSDAMIFLEKKQQTKPGGKLNPHFVEFLMAYPMNWTKVDPTE